MRVTNCNDICRDHSFTIHLRIIFSAYLQRSIVRDAYHLHVRAIHIECAPMYCVSFSRLRKTYCNHYCILLLQSHLYSTAGAGMRLEYEWGKYRHRFLRRFNPQHSTSNHAENSLRSASYTNKKLAMLEIIHRHEFGLQSCSSNVRDDNAALRPTSQPCCNRHRRSESHPSRRWISRYTNTTLTYRLRRIRYCASAAIWWGSDRESDRNRQCPLS